MCFAPNASLFQKNSKRQKNNATVLCFRMSMAEIGHVQTHLVPDSGALDELVHTLFHVPTLTPDQQEVCKLSKS